MLYHPMPKAGCDITFQGFPVNDGQIYAISFSKPCGICYMAFFLIENSIHYPLIEQCYLDIVDALFTLPINFIFERRTRRNKYA